MENQLAKGQRVFTSEVTKRRQAFREENPAAAQILAEWGLGGTGAEETQERISEALR